MGAAVGVFANASTVAATVRNVTARATGNGSLGIAVLSGAGGNATLDAKNVIADGATDALAGAVAGGDVASLSLANSSYTTTSTLGDGIAAVTAAGSGTNQLTAPLLGANLFTQLAGSPTINGGVTDNKTGSLDIDGEPRSRGGAIDIGADEFPLAAPQPPGATGLRAAALKKCQKKKKAKKQKKARKKCRQKAQRLPL
jgi:hypothetical protein